MALSSAPFVSMLLNEDVEMTMFDFSPLHGSWIGFDHLFDRLQNMDFAPSSEGGYPLYNVERTGEETYRISLAVAGFEPDDLTITTEPGHLVVAGRKPQKETADYLYQGIAMRAFERHFNLADYVKVSGARMENGLLVIDLVREVPEALKPRKIEIANANQPLQIESERAA
jgi:molecular chaperone IbpA